MVLKGQKSCNDPLGYLRSGSSSSLVAVDLKQPATSAYCDVGIRFEELPS